MSGPTAVLRFPQTWVRPSCSLSWERKSATPSIPCPVHQQNRRSPARFATRRTLRRRALPARAAAPSRVQDDTILDDLAEAVLAAAEEIAFEAGEIIRRKIGKATQVGSKEVQRDLVTEVDRECEQLITSMVKGTFPLHTVLGEETATAHMLHALDSGTMGTRDWTWIVDPIDGTINFVGGVPLCAVSLGVARGGAMEVGVVYNPLSNEVFSARKGEGAYCNGKLIRRLEEGQGLELELEDAVVAVGFPSKAEERSRMLAAITAVAPHARSVRALGSAALHMSYVAAGRLGCFFEHNLKAWDVAAARLIVEEAGGVVTTMCGSELPLSGGSVLATRGGAQLHNRLLNLLDSTNG